MIQLVLAALLASASPSKPRSLAVMELRSVGVPEDLTRSAELLLPTAVRRAAPGARVISGADIRALLNLERQRQLLGCAEDSCMAELGGALGADELIAGDLGKIGKTFVLELRRIDARRAVSLASATRTFPTEDELVGAIDGAVRELFVAEAPPRPAGAVPPALASASPTATTVAAQPRPQPSRAVAYGALGAGALLLVGGGAAVAWARGVQRDYDAQQPGSPHAGAPTVTRAQASRARALDVAGLVAAPVGLAAAGFGAWQLLSTPSGGPASIAPASPGGGAGLQLQGTF